MSALAEAPLASEVALITLPRLPTTAERPRWVQREDLSDERDQDGSAALFWRRVIDSEAGEMMVEQFVWCIDGVTRISRAYWDGSGYQYELTSDECRAMSGAMWRISRTIEQMDRDALKLAERLGDPWITTTEAAKRLNTTAREVREGITAGDLAAVKVSAVTYVRAAEVATL